MAGPGFGGCEHKSPPIAPGKFDLGKFIFETLQFKLEKLVEEACARGPEAVEEMKEKVKLILTGKE